MGLQMPSRTSHNFGRQTFTVAGPAAWNSLPDYLRDPSLSQDTFRRLLKTYSARSTLEALHNALYKFSTYLLT